nr:unnamed protein product [Callosobruchus chinensis]
MTMVRQHLHYVSEIEAATEATRMKRWVHSVEQGDDVEARATSFSSRRKCDTCQRNPPVRMTLEGAKKLACWKGVFLILSCWHV